MEMTEHEVALKVIRSKISKIEKHILRLAKGNDDELLAEKIAVLENLRASERELMN